jgi:hypothetical protein
MGMTALIPREVIRGAQDEFERLEHDEPEWAGTDCGKTHHHCLVPNTEGDTLLSRRVAKYEPELLKLIGDVLELTDGDQVTCGPWT